MTPKHRLAELPRRSVRQLDPDVIARIFDGPQGEPEVVRRQREFADTTPREGGWLIAGALGALMWVGVYELIRWWFS